MLPINHLFKTLNATCNGLQSFNLIRHDDSLTSPWNARVVNQKSGVVFFVCFQYGTWSVSASYADDDATFLQNRLNGHTRDDAGNVSGGYQFFVDPPMEMTIEAGDEWQFCEDNNNWKPWLPKYLGMTLCDYWKLHKVKQPEKFQIRRRIHDPMFIEPDKVV